VRAWCMCTANTVRCAARTRAWGLVKPRSTPPTKSDLWCMEPVRRASRLCRGLCCRIGPTHRPLFAHSRSFAVFATCCFPLDSGSNTPPAFIFIHYSMKSFNSLHPTAAGTTTSSTQSPLHPLASAGEAPQAVRQTSPGIRSRSCSALPVSLITGANPSSGLIVPMLMESGGSMRIPYAVRAGTPQVVSSWMTTVPSGGVQCAYPPLACVVGVLPA
jgi:hypothetical protein